MRLSKFVNRFGIDNSDVRRCIANSQHELVYDASSSAHIAAFDDALEYCTKAMADTMPPLDEKWRVLAKLVGEAHEGFAGGPTYAIENNHMTLSSRDFVDGNHTKAFVNRLIPFSLVFNDDLCDMMHIDNAGQMFAYMSIGAYNTDDVATLDEEYQASAIRHVLSCVGMGGMFTDEEIGSFVAYPFYTSQLFDKVVDVWSLMWLDEYGPAK